MPGPHNISARKSCVFKHAPSWNDSKMFIVICSVTAIVLKKWHFGVFLRHKIICFKGILLSFVYALPNTSRAHVELQSYSKINSKWHQEKIKWNWEILSLPSLTHLFQWHMMALPPVGSSSHKNGRAPCK